MRRFISIFSLVFFTVLAAPQSIKAVDFGGVSARPTNPVAGDERTQAWFVYALSPGAAKSDTLTIENNSDQEKTFDLYPADSTPTTGNGFALKQQAEKMEAIGSWVAIDKSSITLMAHEGAAVPFKVNIPAGAAPGLYSGGIMLAERTAQKAGEGVSLNLRVGVRMYVTVVGKTVASANSKKNAAPYLALAALIAIAASGAAMVIRSKTAKKRRGSRLR